MTGPVDVLEFWFADSLTNPDTLAERRTIWFMGGSDVDQLITKKVRHAARCGSGRGATALDNRYP